MCGPLGAILYLYGNCNCNLLADTLQDRVLRRIAKQIGKDQMDLGLELQLDYHRIEQIQASHKEHVDATFKMLIVSGSLF